MELITPDFGLLFWMTLAFGIVFAGKGSTEYHSNSRRV